MALHRSLFAAGVVVLAAATRPALAGPDIDAVVTYRTHQVMASGVVRDESWQERVMRRGDAVWSERVLAAEARAAHRHETAAEHVAHKHFDFDGAARLVERDARGNTVLRYVDAKNRVVVSVPRAEYGAVGFDGRWDGAAHLVPPQVVAAMTVVRGAASPGSRWLGDHGDGWTHRVLWSDARAIALHIDSARDDGSFRRTVSVVLQPVAGGRSLPWRDLGSYTQKEYDDFMD